MKVILRFAAITLAAAALCSSAVLAQTKGDSAGATPEKSGAAETQKNVTTVISPSPIEKQNIDQRVTKLLTEGEVKEAVEKSFHVIAKSLGMSAGNKEALSFAIQASKHCAGLPDADVKGVFVVKETASLYPFTLIWVRGEASKDHFLYGKSCDTQVNLTTPFIVVFSYIVEDAARSLSKLRMHEVFDPIAISDKSGNQLAYKSASAIISIKVKSPNEEKPGIRTLTSEVTSGGSEIFRSSDEIFIQPEDAR